MRQDTAYYLLITLFAILVLLAGELIHRKVQVNSEYTRKMVHVIIGLIPLFYPSIFGSHLPVLVLNGQLILLLIAADIYKFIPSLNDVKRRTWGAYLFPVSVYLLFLLYLSFGNPAFYYIPIMVLAICDPIAALSGMAYKSLHQRNSRIRYIGIGKTGKTLAGSASFALSALILTFILVRLFYDIGTGSAMLLSLALALTGTLAEAVSTRGFDNLTVPFTLLAVLLLSLNWL